MDNLAESLLLLTKTNSKVVDKIKELDAKIDSVVVKTTNPSTSQSIDKAENVDDIADKTIKAVEEPKNESKKLYLDNTAVKTIIQSVIKPSLPDKDSGKKQKTADKLDKTIIKSVEKTQDDSKKLKTDDTADKTIIKTVKIPKDEDKGNTKKQKTADTLNKPVEQAVKKSKDVNKDEDKKTIQPAVTVKADVADKPIVKTVEKPKTVIISDFTKEALNDLAGILGGKQVEAAKPNNAPPEKSKSGNKLLGWLAAAAGTYAIIKNFKLENIPGLITGIQSAKKRITKLKGAITKTFSKMKGAFKKIVPKGLQNSITKNINKFKTKSKALFSKVANKITSSIKNVGAKAAGLAKNLGSKALKAFTTSMSALGSKIKTVLNSAKTAVTKTISSAAGGVDDIAKGMKGVPAPKPTGASGSAPKPKTSFFGKISDKVSKASKSVVATASKAKGAVVATASKAKGAGINLAKKAINVGFKAVGGVKKLAGALVKSPLLAPIVESVLAYKDINKSIEEYNTGEIDKKELDKRIGTRTIKGLGGNNRWSSRCRCRCCSDGFI